MRSDRLSYSFIPIHSFGILRRHLLWFFGFTICLTASDHKPYFDLTKNSTYTTGARESGDKSGAVLPL